MKDVVVVVGARRDAGAPQTGPGPRVQGLGVQSRYAVAQAAKEEESMRCSGKKQKKDRRGRIVETSRSA
jgi:hypothetical protein